ncbi:MAG: sigma-54-dependent Fis family transcriptional regulator [Deltaproteobacteria bacterium]|nr:sigma-54-dependent Fis family transcriptional regulator [Deltaproteobacteria bacterium]
MSKNSQQNNKKRLLIIDDEENMRHMLMAMLKKFDYEVQAAADGQQGLLLMDESKFDFVLCDIKMPNMDGMTFLLEADKRKYDTTIIMMSAYGSVETAIAAMKNGAYDYISKPFKADEVQMTLKKAEEREGLKRENRLLRERISHIEENYCFRNMIGKSSTMKEVFKLVEKVAQYNTTVLISGESGTGKELIAKGIHLAGNRSEQNLVSVNCGGIPENLLESEFFGYKKGAFTGADRDKKGLFQEADKGTIFLDEIGELSLSLQVKLLRVLQESEIRPVGSTKSVPVDVRILAATQKNLEDEVSRGHFREDLFYRLNVLSIHLPPLRDRLEDVPLLMDHFIGRFNKRLGKNIRSASPAATAYLLAYHWPGNIRELENIIERAVVLSDEDQILPSLLPPALTDRPEPAYDEEMDRIYSLKHARKMLEKKMIVRALTETQGNRTRASKLLEISHPSLLSKMKTYEIDL